MLCDILFASAYIQQLEFSENKNMGLVDWKGWLISLKDRGTLNSSCSSVIIRLITV